jgi:membrane-associated phospholipid phosphatase
MALKEVSPLMAIHEKARTDAVVPETCSHLLREAGYRPATPAVVGAAIPRAWDVLLARTISQVGSPPVLSAAATALVAATLSSPSAWHWAAVYVSVAILTPILYLVWLLCQGQITGLGLPRREQRVRPLIFTSACAGLAWLVLAQGGAPQQMVALARGLWLEMVVILGITLSWKISVHAAVAASVAMLAWSLSGTPVPLLIGVPVVAWSRVRLRHHAVDETVAGALLGLTTFFIAV